MEPVTLKHPTGVTRTTTDPDRVRRLAVNGWDVVKGQAPPGVGFDPGDAPNVDALRAYAEANGIDLTGLTLRSDIEAAIADYDPTTHEVT